MKLTEEQISDINKLCPNDWEDNCQGIYKEPFGVPDKEKRLVVYMRYSIGGVSGGSCWDNSNPQPYTNHNSKPKFTVLDLILKELTPNISYLQFREIESLILKSSGSKNDYYGNCTDFDIEYIVLDDLLKLLETFNS